MIKNKADLQRYLQQDMRFFYQYPKKERIIYQLTNDPVWQIVKYIKLLRKEEYYFNTRKNKMGTLMVLWCLSRKNMIGNRIGFKIPRNTFEEGLTIYHHGGVIVNEDVKVGKNAVLHGDNCIGNDGTAGGKVAVIGDGLDLGIGAKVIGDVKLGNQVIVGANAVVTRSFANDNIILVGIPAREL